MVKLHHLKLYRSEENHLNNTGIEIKRLNYIKMQWLGLQFHFNISMMFKKSMFKLFLLSNRCIRIFNIFFLFHSSLSQLVDQKMCIIWVFSLFLWAGKSEYVYYIWVFSLSLSLSLKTRKWCVICFFLSLSLSWKTRTRSWTEKWRTCRLGTVLPPLLHF